MKIKRKSKYNVNQTKKGKRNRTYNGKIFDSELEMRYYRDIVCVGLKNGIIKECKRQIKYELQPKFSYNNKTILPINYVADFVITYADGSELVIDTKGLPDAVAKLKKKMFHYKYPEIDYRWIGYSKVDGGWLDYSEIEKGRRERKKIKTKNK